MWLRPTASRHAPLHRPTTLHLRSAHCAAAHSRHVTYHNLSRYVALASDGKVPRVRGMPMTKSSLYTPGADSECLDGSQLIILNKVNDDYCDCAVAMDEPDTATCANGAFYCQNSKWCCGL